MICNLIDKIPEDYLPIGEVCYQLGMTQVTLTRWYNWYEDNYESLPTDFPKLPKGRNGLMSSENRKYHKKVG